MHNLSKNAKISRGATVSAGAAGTSAINGASLDMVGFQSALAIIPLGAIVSTGTISIKWQGSSDNSTWADLAGTAQAFDDTADDTLVYSEITPLPAHRYVRIVVTRATANGTVGGIQYIQYGARKLPVVHGANVSGELAVDPAEGTA